MGKAIWEKQRPGVTRSDLKWKMGANDRFHSILHHKTKPKLTNS